MPGPFNYSTYVTSKSFIGRKNDVTIMSNLLGQGEHICIYEPPKSGKMSLVQQVLYELKISTVSFTAIDFSLLNVRTCADLAMHLGSKIISSIATTEQEYAETIAHYLGGTHFIFDPEAYSSHQMILSLNWDIDDDDIKSIFELPFRIASEKGIRIFLILEEFQNIMQTGSGDHLCRILESVIKEEPRGGCSYIFMGSCFNAMKEIFEHKHRFYHMVERIALSEIDTKELIEGAVRGFLTSGKVLDRDLMLGVCKLFRNNPWYINHFLSISDHLSKGYIMEPILVEALDILLSIHRPRFEAIMNDLTTFQVCLLRAILDGHTKFSSTEVIKHYNLNSSANVKRLKEALCKKEIITFNEKDDPIILDPLFEYWAAKYFFEIK